MVVIACCENHRARTPAALGAARRASHHSEHRLVRFGVRLATNGDDLLVQRYLQLVGIDDSTVVAQRFHPGRLGVRGGERQAPNLQKLGRREKDHVRREMQDRVDDRALLDDSVRQPCLLGGDCGGETGGAGADNEEVDYGF